MQNQDYSWARRSTSEGKEKQGTENIEKYWVRF
jgi:hypothetical protein